MTRREYIDLQLVIRSIQQIVTTYAQFEMLIEPFKTDFNRKYKGKRVKYLSPKSGRTEILFIEGYIITYFKCHFFTNKSYTRRFFDDMELI